MRVTGASSVWNRAEWYPEEGKSGLESPHLGKIFKFNVCICSQAVYIEQAGRVKRCWETLSLMENVERDSHKVKETD